MSNDVLRAPRSRKIIVSAVNFDFVENVKGRFNIGIYSILVLKLPR